MARKASRAPQHVEPEDISQEELEQREQDEEPEASGDAPNKSQAARAAVDAGYDKPAEAVAYIKKSFGIDMNPQHFSAIKSQYRKKQAKNGAPRATRGRKPKVEPEGGYLAPPPKAQEPATQPDLLAALEAMKPLVDNLGKAQVHRLVDLLG